MSAPAQKGNDTALDTLKGTSLVPHVPVSSAPVRYEQRGGHAVQNSNTTISNLISPYGYLSVLILTEKGTDF